VLFALTRRGERDAEIPFDKSLSLRGLERSGNTRLNASLRAYGSFLPTQFISVKPDALTTQLKGLKEGVNLI